MSRLTYNAWRRGLYDPYVFLFFCFLLPSSSSFDADPKVKQTHSNEEDYRWAVLRKKISPWFFQVTNLVFIGQF